VSSELSRIPVPRRRHAAALLGLFAVFLVAVGVLPWAAETSTVVRVLAAIVIVVAVLLALVAWGLLQSTIVDERRQAEAELDAVLIEAAGPAGACGCGQVHDPDELHITDAQGIDTCGHDGGGTDCAHTCDTCVLSTLRR
jgi:hypothetical protein